MQLSREAREGRVPAAMRITGGTLRGRTLKSSRNAELRPTSERVREAIFSALEASAGVNGKRVLDLYAGTGALGLEALSRGAEAAVFVEQSRQSCRTLEDRLVEFQVRPKGTVVCADVKGVAARLTGCFDLVFIDPPYAEHPGSAIISELLAAGRCIPGTVFIVESAARPALDLAARSEGLRAVVTREREYGDTKISYLLVEEGSDGA